MDNYEFFDKQKKKFGGIARLVVPAYVFGHQLPETPKFIISNHLTLFDPAITYFYTDGFKRFLSKIEARSIKILSVGKRLEKMGCIFIDRQSKAGDLRAVKSILSANKAGEDIVIFPEGTRNKTKTTDVQPIKEGIALFVAKTGSTVVPMVFYKRQKIFVRNYSYIGEPIDFSEYKGKSINEEEIEKIQRKLFEVLDENKRKLDAFMQNGGAKKIKKLYKEQRKIKKKKVFIIDAEI